MRQLRLSSRQPGRLGPFVIQSRCGEESQIYSKQVTTAGITECRPFSFHNRNAEPISTTQPNSHCCSRTSNPSVHRRLPCREDEKRANWNLPNHQALRG